MKYNSVLNLFLKPENKNYVELQEQIIRGAKQVTEGRYLISVFSVLDNWEKRIPIESLIISNTLGQIEGRSTEWEYYGNGAIRCYKSNNLRLTKTLQWNIVRRQGDKPYSRRSEQNKSSLNGNTIPVSDKTFTRDVANNVWHLKDEDLTARLIARFAALLAWNDEKFTVITGKNSKVYDDRARLDLKDDLVGVPTKIPYLWNSDDVLF